MSRASDGRLLTFNCHEAWVHQLGTLGRPLDIVDGLPGRYTAQWDTRMRPVPERARLVSLEQAALGGGRYDAIVGHNLTDLLAVPRLAAPRILMLHVTLEHRVAQAHLDAPPRALAQQIDRYLELAGGIPVAVSAMKAKSWGLADCRVVESAVDPADYLPYEGTLPIGLRVANQVSSRRQYLAWDLHEAAFAGMPVRLFGHNPDMPGVAPARDWDELKRALRAHRFFIHTADPALEDGFNMALMEALAAGMPVVGNAHPSSPIEHGVSGWLSDDPKELASSASRLFEDLDLARTMGAAARRLAEQRFPRAGFVRGMEEAMAAARRRWERAQARRVSG